MSSHKVRITANDRRRSAPQEVNMDDDDDSFGIVHSRKSREQRRSSKDRDNRRESYKEREYD